MRRTIRDGAILGLIVGIASLAAATSVEAQTVTADQGREFLGDWEMTLDTPEGTFPLSITVTEADGRVAAEVGTGDQGQPLEGLTRAENRLIGRFDLDYQGMVLPVVISMSRDGEGLQAEWNFADGMFVAVARGTRR